MTAQLHDTNVCMDGLLEVLGKNLYSTPEVAIRELVQNAHDACIRRQIEQGECPTPVIELSPDSHNNTLTIKDTGSGLTYDEVISYLATVGSGYTRVLRDKSQTDDMIGYFGLGFLSAYVVADKVDVWTTSYQTPGCCWHFSSRGGKRFVINQDNNNAQANVVGTTVKLQLSDNFSQLGSSNVLHQLLTKYCCMLPIKIIIKGDTTPVNDLSVPWRLHKKSPLAFKKEQMNFAQIFETTFEPICVFPIDSDNEANIQGLVWVQDAGGFATSDYRNVSIFVRNMFITHQKRELLPVWAGFAGCVVVSERLTPTASREDIQSDEAFWQTQKVISQTLIAGLKKLASDEPQTWRRVLLRHNQALMGAAINDDALFEVLVKQLKLPTNMGDMTLPKLLENTNNCIYLRMEDRNSYEDILLRARMIPSVSGYLFAASSFCQKYADIYGTKIIRLGNKSADQQLLNRVTPQCNKAQYLTGLFTKPGDQVLFTEVQPSHLPLIIVEDQEVLLKQKIEQDESDKRIGSAVLMLAKLHTNKIDDAIKRRVYINLSCPLIDKLISWQQQPARAQQLANMTRSFIELMCQDAFDEQTGFSGKLKQFNEAVLTMVELGE